MTVNGISYLVLGGGAELQSSDYDADGFDSIYAGHHFACFEIKSNVLYATIIDEHGTTIDRFSLVKSPKADFVADRTTGPKIS